MKSRFLTTTNDSTILRYYDSLFGHYQYSNNDSILFYMRQGLSLFTIHKYKRGIADMLSNMAGVYSEEGMFEIAERAGMEALDIYKGTANKPGIANTNNILGVVQGKKGNYPEALNHFQTALMLFREIKDTDGVADTYIKLGVAHEMQNQLDLALAYYDTGLALVNNKPVNDVFIFLNNNIGNIYHNKNDLVNAEKYYQIALFESRDTKFSRIHILPLINLGYIHAEKGENQEALDCYKQAKKLARMERLNVDLVNVDMDLANLFLKSDKKTAIAYMNEALETAKSVGLKNLESDVITSLVEVYKNTNNYKEAYNLVSLQKKLADSIYLADKEKTVVNLEALNDVDKLNAKVQQLEFQQQKQNQNQKITIIVTLCITFLAVIIFVFFWKTKLLNGQLADREKGLNNSIRIKNKLISIIAHDLIGAIHFMPVAIGLYKDDSVPETEKKSLLNQVELSAISSYETLQNMLDWGKAQIQGISLKQEPFNIAEISNEVIQFTKIEAANKQIKLDCELDPHLFVYADPNHFKFILRNLVSNAIKYTNNTGEIRITARKSGDGEFVQFSVQDNGIGIRPEQLPFVFEPGMESRPGTNNEKGNGIGLRLCREFIMENGGKIWAESEIYKGSEFHFTLKTFNRVPGD